MKRYIRSVMDLERGAEESASETDIPESGAESLSPSALWGELVAAVSVEAASRSVRIEVEVEDDEQDYGEDSSAALRIFRNLTLSALRLTARDACLRIRVRGTDEQQLVEMESVCSSEADGRPRLYRASRSVPSEESFAVNAARSYFGPRGGSVVARYMQDLGVSFAVHIPRDRATRNAG